MDQKGVIYYELLKPGETVNTERYRQQMIDLNQALREKRPEYQKGQHKVILLHDNAPSHTAKPVKETIEAFSWETLSHAAYSPNLALSDYYLFASMGQALSDQHFTSYENVRKWLDGSTNCQIGGENVQLAMGNTSNKIFLIIFIQ